MLSVCETFASIQGESTRAGRKCFFIRLAGCSLDCSYCDTGYAKSGGRADTVEHLVELARASGLDLVEVTGGEPLEQAETPRLCRALLDAGSISGSPPGDERAAWVLVSSVDDRIFRMRLVRGGETVWSDQVALAPPGQTSP